MYTGIRLLLLIHPFISSFFFLSNFQHWNFLSHFSRELWGLEDWKLVYTWTVGRCIMYTRIRLLLLIHPFISSFFFLSNFQHWNLSSHFSQALWGIEDFETWYTHTPWTDVSCILESGCCFLFIPLFLHFSFSPVFKHESFSSHFSQELWGLEDWNLVHMWIVGRCILYTGIRLLLLICPFISSFFFLFNY